MFWKGYVKNNEFALLQAYEWWWQESSKYTYDGDPRPGRPAGRGKGNWEDCKAGWIGDTYVTILEEVDKYAGENGGCSPYPVSQFKVSHRYLNYLEGWNNL